MGIIKDFVVSVLNSRKNVLSQKVITNVTKRCAEIILTDTGINIEGYSHVIDNYSVKHVLLNHGSISETKRGQLPVVLDDFDLIKQIVNNFDSVTNGGKNKQGRDILIFEKLLEKGNYIYLEEVRSPKKKQVVLQTMYIKKRK